METLVLCIITFIIGLFLFRNGGGPERSIDRELLLERMDAARAIAMQYAGDELAVIDRQVAETREKYHWRRRNEDLRWELLLLSLNNDARATVRAMSAAAQLEHIPSWTEHLVEHALNKEVGWPMFTAPFSLEEWIALQRNDFTRNLTRPFVGPLGWVAPWREQVTHPEA